MNRRNHLLSVVGCCLLLVLTACQKSSPPTSHPIGSFGTSSGSGPGPTVTKLSSACPLVGTARPGILTKMVAGTSPVFVYVYNNIDTYQPAHHIATLFRYDSTNGSKTEIATFHHSNLFEVQLSTDGQWILFVHQHDSGLQELQMVRLDGKGLQTLYCVSHDTYIGNIVWSPDQMMVAFFEVTQQQNVYASTLKLLQLATGKLDVAVEQQKTVDAQKQFTLPEKWLDNTHLYVSGSPLAGEVYPSNLYLLDLTKGLPQSMSSLPQLITANQPFFNFALSLDHSMLYTSQCFDQEAALPIVFEGPSRVTVQPALGGPTKTILQTPMAVTGVRAISSTTLLLIVNRTQAPGDQNAKVLAQNGLWKINTDGTGLSLVWHASGQQMISFNQSIFNENDAFAFSSHGLYITKITNENGDQFLSLRSLSDSLNQIFAQISKGETVDPVGWATI